MSTDETNNPLSDLLTKAKEAVGNNAEAATGGVDSMLGGAFANIEQQVKDAVQQGTDAAIDKIKEIASGALGGIFGGAAKNDDSNS